MKPITQLLGLQVLLGQVLQVALAVSMIASLDNNLVTSAVTADGDGAAELTGLAVDLETVMQEVLEGSNVEDGIGGRTSAVDGELGVLVGDVLLSLYGINGWMVSGPNSQIEMILYCEDGHY